MRKFCLALVVVILFLAGVSPAAAQSDVPQWAADMQAQLARIEAQNAAILRALDSGVKLAAQQGAVAFRCDLDHAACFTVRNSNPGGYGASLWGGAVGLHAEGLVGGWFVGDDSGAVFEGNISNGAQFIGPKAGMFAQAWNGYGIQAKGASGPVSPDWRKSAR